MDRRRKYFDVGGGGGLQRQKRRIWKYDEFNKECGQLRAMSGDDCGG